MRCNVFLSRVFFIATCLVFASCNSSNIFLVDHNNFILPNFSETVIVLVPENNTYHPTADLFLAGSLKDELNKYGKLVNDKPYADMSLKLVVKKAEYYNQFLISTNADYYKQNFYLEVDVFLKDLRPDKKYESNFNVFDTYSYFVSYEEPHQEEKYDGFKEAAKKIATQIMIQINKSY